MKKMLNKALGLFLLLFFLIGSHALAQQTITGKVVDKANGETLPGVSVSVSGTMQATLTDIDGNYSLKLESKAAALTFSMIGYTSQTIPVSNGNVINVMLETTSISLEGVVVTGYGGTVKRSKLTNSIASVKDEVLKIGIHSNPAQALSGAVSGLKVIQSSGKPGAQPTIILRGGTNLNGTGSPLVVVDGIVRSSLSDINPEDIEQMDILKDAGATALYGARANNGVILVTTKRGKSGFSEISVKTRVGFNYLNEPYKFLGAEDYLKWVRQGTYDAGHIYQKADASWTGYGAGNAATLSAARPYGTGNLYWDPANPTVPLDGNKTTSAIWSPMLYSADLAFLLDKGWKKMTDPVTGQEIIYSEFNRASTAFNTPAATQDYNVSLTGGNDKGNYYAGLGYYYENGLPIQTWYNRLNFTFNGDYKVRTWLTSSSSFQYNNATWKDVTTTTNENYFARMLSAPPTQREYNAAGQLLLGPNLGDGNPLYNIDKFMRRNQTDKFAFGQGFKFDILEDLNLKVNGSWIYDEGFYESFNKDYLNSPGVLNTTRSSAASYDRSLRQTYNAVLNYSIEILPKHSISALLGSEYFDEYARGIVASGSGAPTDDFADLQYTSTKEGKRGTDTYHVRERILSAFGNIKYDYDTKYLASFTFRQDGYSRLLGDNRWGFFPGVSLGWVFTKEDFMKKYDNIINFGKLRASYGLNGNVSAISGAYTLQGIYGTGLYNTQTTYFISTLPNPNLRWEKSKTAEIGLDLGLLKNKLNINFTYYNRLTSDKHFSVPLPVSSGISGITANIGQFRNKGVEVDVNAKVLDNKNFKWDVGANMSYNKNVVVKLVNNGLERNRQNAFQVYDPATGKIIFVGGYQEGQTPGDMYAFHAIGIYKDDAQIKQLAANLIDKTTGDNGSDGKKVYGPDAWAALSDADKAKGSPIRPGDVIWEDVNKDGVIDNMDMVKVGSSVPKYIGGFNTRFSWKYFTLNARMDYALGFQQMDGVAPWFMGMMQGTYNTIGLTKETWTESNPNAKYPKYLWADQLGKRNYARPSTLFVYNAGYLAFREVSLTYSLPGNIIKYIHLTGLDVSVSGQNLGYLTKSKLYSPEVGGTVNRDNTGYPLPRTVIFGLNLKF